MHIFKYRILCFVRNKTLVFWTLAFPVALSTLFFFAFANLDSEGTLTPIPIAIVDEGNVTFNEVMKELSSKENTVFKVIYTTKEDGIQKMKDSEVVAVIVSKEVPKVIYTNETIEVSIVEEVVQSFMRTQSTVHTISSQDPQLITQSVLQDMLTSKVKLDDTTMKSGAAKPSVQYFYTVIAMTCLYGAFWGLKSMQDIQANQSMLAARQNVAPTHKMKLVCIDYIAAFLLMSAELAVVYAYLVFVLQISFGNQIPIMILITIASICASLGLGILIGAMSKLKENTNIAIISAGSLASCFLAGMMISQIPYLINQSAPIVKYINPASLITNSFNILYYYEDISSVYINIAILFGIGLLSLVISYQRIRRKTYASI